MDKCVVVDNGACSLKVAHKDHEIRVLPNGIFKAKNDRKKDFTSGELSNCKDFSSLYYQLPFQKGYLLNWDIQRKVWDYTFGKNVLNLDQNEIGIVMTEPHFNFSCNKSVMNEMFFEEYNFDRIFRTNASTLASYKYMAENLKEHCCLVVDSGYSFTHIVPYNRNKKIINAVCRIDVGGKFLTNYLKEVVSFRQLQVMDETYVINQMKEDACYVSNKFDEDMKVSSLRGKQNTVLRHYVLPDFTKIHRGVFTDPFVDKSKVDKSQQIVQLANERFTIPEVLFNPSDLSIDQMGIAEAIVYSVSKCPPELRTHLLRNIVVCGGNFNLEGIKQRLYDEVRKLTSDEIEISISLPLNPVTYACSGGVEWVNGTNNNKWVTQLEYQEYGPGICDERFGHI